MCIQGQTSTVTYISQLENGNLISCSEDCSIKIWYVLATSYKCEYTIGKAYIFTIFMVIPLSENRLASCSRDNDNSN